MRSRSRLLIAALALPAALLAFSPAAHATSIGVNINSGDAATALNPTDSAGVPSVAQANWNNTINSPSSGGNTVTGLVNSAGAPTNVGVSWQAGADWQNSEGATWGFSGNDATLMTGFMQLGTGNFTFSNIPYSSYNVYVYLGDGGNGGVGQVSIANAGSSGTVDPNTYSYFYGWQSGNWTQATDTTLSSAISDWQNGTNAANYVEFSNNTAFSFTISHLDPYYIDNNGGYNWYGGWSGPAAFEIVNTGVDLSAVPEPASIGLLSAGSLMLLRRRR
jgi:hypothetical protein